MTGATSIGGAARSAAATVRRRVRATGSAIRLLVRRPDGVAIATLVGLAYLASYLWLTELLWVGAGRGVSWQVVDDPLARLFDRTGPFSFEPIALVDLWIVRALVSPIDLAVGAGLAVLVGLNLGLAYLAIVQPRACGIGAGTGLAASVPALLSGSVCCAPVVAIALGIQLGGTALTVLPWLLPIGVALLLGSLVYVGGLVGADSGAGPA